MFNNTVADPGFHRWGEGENLLFGFSFGRKLHKNERNWTWLPPSIRQCTTHHIPSDHSSAQLLFHRRRQHTGTGSFLRRSSLYSRDISYIPMTFCSKVNIWNSLKLLPRNTVPDHTLQFKRDRVFLHEPYSIRSGNIV